MYTKIRKAVNYFWQWMKYSFVCFGSNAEIGHVKLAIFNVSLEEQTLKKWKFRTFVNTEGMSINEIVTWLNRSDEFSFSSVFHPFIKFGNASGYDIKDYWEIGRFNFLTEKQIMDCAVTEKELVSLISSKSLRKIGYGVQWKCAMDVAIRLINLSLLNGMNSKPITKEISYFKFIEGSADYILMNLEKYGDWRGNHYLTNLAGLLIYAISNKSNKSNKILDFALLELDIELERQFLSDGSNFEGSSAYHFFGLELLSVTHTVLKSFNYIEREIHYKNPYLVTSLGIKKCKFSPGLFREVVSKLESKIAKGLKLAASILDNEGRLIQIGDNDSGRVFRTSFLNDYSPDFYADILFQISESLKNGKFPCLVEGRQFFIEHLNSLRDNSITPEFGSEKISDFTRMFDLASCENKNTHLFLLKGNFSEFKIKNFDCFGLVVARNEDSILTFRCGPIGQLGKGGHDHYDQLSITLTSCGERIISDPGVGCYTKDISVRNKYRSSKSHFGVHGKKDFDNVSELFRITSTPSKLIAISKNEILGFQQVRDVEKYRKISFFGEKVVVKDIIVNDEISSCYEEPPYSPGYGIIEHD
ncbi:heparinase II/III family protein [Vibrio vulnificus]|nr:heparinase II/III family protein [Vibrio vulnificus]ELS3556117.1 heparinase II/III family protein [Vibrio vulnificus]ELS9098784.1 heparinase II/III family protein [Vibrio vulnificus]